MNKTKPKRLSDLKKIFKKILKKIIKKKKIGNKKIFEVKLCGERRDWNEIVCGGNLKMIFYEKIFWHWKLTKKKNKKKLKMLVFVIKTTI